MPETWADLRKARGSRYGVNGDVAVTNAAGGTRVLGNNPRRIAVVMTNNENNPGHAAFGGKVPTTTSGARLDSQGGVISMSLEEDGTVVQDEIRIILETAAGNIHVVEIEEA